MKRGGHDSSGQSLIPLNSKLIGYIFFMFMKKQFFLLLFYLNFSLGFLNIYRYLVMDSIDKKKIGLSHL